MVPTTITTLAHFERECQSDTHAYLASAPGDLVNGVVMFDELFLQLYRFSCCYWGCHGREHIFEHLAGRCVSSLASGWRLAESGYYDETLSCPEHWRNRQSSELVLARPL